jgi:agmatine/peptidylarginine deiminase
MHTLQDRFAHRRSFTSKGKLRDSGPIFDTNGENKYEARDHTRFNDQWGKASKWIKDEVVARNYRLLCDFVDCYVNDKAYAVYE